jgi:hypothetical protein
VRFGPVTAAGRPGIVTDVAGDRRALTTTFSEFEVTVDAASGEPDPTKTFSMTLPLTGGAEGETLKVYAQGYAFLDAGATASVTLRGGGRTVVKGFASGSDDSYLQALELPARPGVTYQLSFAVDVHRGAGEGAGDLNMLSIDVEIS